jgi:allantoinase
MRKGSIAVGCDADIVIWNPRRKLTVNANQLEHRHKLTPYHGESLQGVVEKTFLRGRKIYDSRHKEAQEAQKQVEKGKVLYGGRSSRRQYFRPL